MADWGHGTTLGYAAAGTAVGGSFTSVAYIKEIDAKTLTRKVVDITVLASASNTEESRAGMITPESFKFTLQYGKTVHAALLAMVVADSPNRAWKITLSDNSTVHGDGFITKFNELPRASNDGVYENDIEIKPIGPWTFTAAA